MFTYKLHTLGDYSILWFGTGDSYSTQPLCIVLRARSDADARQGELEHRRANQLYARTSKNRATKQITALERRERGLTDMLGANAYQRAALEMSKRKATQWQCSCHVVAISGTPMHASLASNTSLVCTR